MDAQLRSLLLFFSSAHYQVWPAARLPGQHGRHPAPLPAGGIELVEVLLGSGHWHHLGRWDGSGQDGSDGRLSLLTLQGGESDASDHHASQSQPKIWNDVLLFFVQSAPPPLNQKGGRVSDMWQTETLSIRRGWVQSKELYPKGRIRQHFSIHSLCLN